MSTPPPLADRVALVTGVSRPAAIATTVSTRLHDLGATVVATGWPPHDSEMPWGGDAQDVEAQLEHDLADPTVPGELVDEVVDRHGRLDIVIAAHARSSTQGLAELTAAELERSWRVNVQSVLLLAQAFAAVHRPAPVGERPIGRMVWFTSGQHLQPMEGQLPYSVTKGALHQMTASVAKALSASRIVANCVNPGPVDTGYASPELHQRVAAMFPDGAWGTPSQVADLIAFLVSDQGAWIRGQVLDSEGGFDRVG